MALIVRIDVDRPYGQQGFVRHVASRISSDYFLPRMEWLRYLEELQTILRILNANGKSAYVFFHEELQSLQQKLGRPVTSFSKHGSGSLCLGRHHYAPYEPERYLPWGKQAGMKVFFGNLEDPQLRPTQDDGLLYFPSAFWLEPYWRDAKKFPIQWLLSEAAEKDVVLLLHPDNVTASPAIMQEFLQVIEKLETVVPTSL